MLAADRRNAHSTLLAFFNRLSPSRQFERKYVCQVKSLLRAEQPHDTKVSNLMNRLSCRPLRASARQQIYAFCKT